VDWVQIRERTLESGALLALAREISNTARDAARGRPVSVLVNRRVDIALAIEAGGVHLGFDAMTPGDASALLGPEAAIGRSLHDADEIDRAVRDGATYAHLAPIWAPRSKPATRPALGAAALGPACARGLPVLAQGGLSAERCAEAIAAGAAGVAVTGAILMAEDPGAATESLRRALDGAKPRS
jgi:thiamine-phosphate pyrophosphorylase